MVQAVIITPTQGDDVTSFQSAAAALNEQVYHGDATVVKTTVTEEGGGLEVTFVTGAGHAFSWETAHNLGSVLTVSHGGMCDGPNLSHGAKGYQPWDSGGDCGQLSHNAKAFWEGVGKVLRSDGKVILVGCQMGWGYASAVAAVLGKPVYASTGALAAGDAATAVKYVGGIERGKVQAPMKRFTR